MFGAALIALALAADPAAKQPTEAELLKTFRDEFVEITPGQGEFPASFVMGGADHGPKSQLPRHEVRLGHTFSIAKYEVPQNLWEAVMGSNPSRWKGKRNSVEMLTFTEAEEFCRRVTKKLREAKLIGESQFVRLPSEAEWEYCCRAGTTTVYGFGDRVEDLDAYAWHTGNAAGNDPPVGAKKPNAWGLYDMHGYLWEWCSDRWHDNYAGAPSDGGGWFSGDPQVRVLRSGSWKDRADQLTCSARRAGSADLKDDAVGLRCVLEGGGITFTFSKHFIVPHKPQLELLWGDGEFTEGPALAPDGSIFFSDIGDAIYRFDPQTKKTELFRKPSGRANGLMFDQQGRLIVCEGANTGGGRRISITTGIQGNKDGEVRTLADSYDGKRFNSPNDLAIDRKGNVYFTDPRYVGEEPRELDFEGVFYVTADGKVSIATREVEKPNGIAVSPDGKTVWIADHNPTGARHLVRFDANDDGTLSNKRVVYDFKDGRGIDGMTLNYAGWVFATAGTGDNAVVALFNRIGPSEGFIRTPGDPTNCVFGVPESDGKSWLYVTAATGKDGKYGLYRIKLSTAGHHVVKLRTDKAK
jgi:gluconolactonase